MKTKAMNIGKVVKITIGIFFILAGTIILGFAQTGSKCSNEAMLKNFVNEIENAKIQSNLSSISYIILPVRYATLTASTDENFIAEVSEEKVDLEGWMLDKTHFSALLAEEKEDEIGIEEWMLNASHFENTSYKEEVTDFEENLKVEEWMLDEKHFQEETEEESLQVEGWMLNATQWINK